MHQLFIDFKKASDSVRREVLYNILIEFGIPMKLVRLIKMCLNKTYARARVGKYVSDMFPMKNVWKQGKVLSPLLFNRALEYAIRMVEEFRYLGTTLSYQNSIQEEIKSRLKSGNDCYHSVQNLASSSLLS